jgi:hypothetical protein
MRDEPDLRNDLIGYLLNALDEREQQALEAALGHPARGGRVRRDLEVMRLALAPLECDREPFPAPAGLADRTVRLVTTRAPSRSLATPRGVPSDIREVPARPLSPASDWRPAGSRAWIDRLIIGATALAACVLVAPLLLDVIAESRARRAERNLQRISVALQGYADGHRMFPTPPDSGPLSRAGLYAPTLVSEERIVADDGTLVCPGTALSQQAGFRVPSLEEVQAAVGTPRFQEMVRTMGGDYGYTLGHRDGSGSLQPNRNRHRTHFPIMADAPDESCERSSNHPDGIHHVLHEDGHIKTLRPQFLHRHGHLYRNRLGKVAAGVDPDDAVIGHSERQP